MKTKYHSGVTVCIDLPNINYVCNATFLLIIS